MNREKFLQELKLKLGFLKPKDREEVLSYYEEIILGAIEDGINEEIAISRLGSMNEIISKIVDEYFQEEDSNVEQVQETFVEMPFIINRTPLEGFSSKKGRYQKTLNVTREKASLTCNLKTVKLQITGNNSNNIVVDYYNKKKGQFQFYSQGNNLIIDEIKPNIKKHVFWEIFFTTLTVLSIFLFGFFFGNKWYNYLISASIIVPLRHLLYLPHIIAYYHGHHHFNLSLPNQLIENFNLRNNSGTINIENLICDNLAVNSLHGNLKLSYVDIKQIRLELTNGSLKFINQQGNLFLSKDISIFVKNGNVKASNLLANNISLQSKNGNIKLDSITGQEKVVIQSKNGNISGLDISSHLLTFANRNGNIKGINMTSDNIAFNTTNGGIKIDNIKANDIVAKTRNGSIKLNNIAGSQKDYFVEGRIKSGTIKINGNSERVIRTVQVTEMPNKTLIAATKSGMIKLNFADDYIKY